MHRYRDWRDERDWDDRFRDQRLRDDFERGRDFGWRGTELDRGFAGGYGYRSDADRHPFDRDRDRGYFGGDRYRDDRYRDDIPYRDDRDRYRDDDRYRYASGDPYLDRGYERPRDDRDIRFRDFRDDYPWNRYRR